MGTRPFAPNPAVRENSTTTRAVLIIVSATQMASFDHLLNSDTTVRRRSSSDLDSSKQYASTTSSSSESGMRAHPRRCSVPDCQKTAKRGGRCIGHGGGNKCAVEGCTTSVVSRGLCVAHGGGKRCQTPACTKSAQCGGFCWVHGGGKKCGYGGCAKRAQSGGSCIAHGGGKRCRTDGCNKVVQYDGLCVGHGGYRRCISENCGNRAMANDYCQQHGGSSVCVLTTCYKRAVRGGMCSKHKAEASLLAVTASGLSTPSQSDDAGYQVQHSRWRSVVDSDRSSLEIRSPNPCAPKRFLENNNAPRSPVSGAIKTERRGDSPPMPLGISALLNGDEKYPSFSTYTKKVESTDNCVRRHHHQEQKVYPILPRLEALHNYCNTRSPGNGRPSGSTPVTKCSQSEHRIVVTEDLARVNQTPTTDTDYQEEDERDKLYVQSYYYRKHAGEMVYPTQRYDWGRRHT